MSTHEDRTTFTRRGRRMSMDTVPRFDGFPPPIPGFTHSGLPPKPGPDFFMPRFPYFPGLPNGGFIPKHNEIPVIQNSGLSHPGLISPIKSDARDGHPVKPMGHSSSGPHDKESEKFESRVQPQTITQSS